MMRNLLLAIISIMMVFTGLFTPFVAEAATANTAKNLPEFRKIVKTNLTNLNKEFKVVYRGNQATLNKNLKNIIPTEIKKDALIDATVSQYKYRGQKYTGKMVITYNVSYFSTKAQERYAKKEAKKIAKNIMKKNKGQLNRVKAVNDYIVSNTTYGGTTNARYTTYGVLRNKIAVCQGYSITGYRILKEMNIPVKYVKGTSKKQNHSWLKVKVSGKWYNLDITWNDPVPNDNYNKSYKYFLLSDSQLRKTHNWKSSDYPKAINKKYNFLNQTSSVAKNGNTLYYANDKDRQRLYSFNSKTGKHKKISHTRVQNLVYKKGKLYFSNYSASGKLAKMNTNGKKKVNLNQTYTSKIYVKGSKVIYFTKGNFYQRNA